MYAFMTFGTYIIYIEITILSNLCQLWYYNVYKNICQSPKLTHFPYNVAYMCVRNCDIALFLYFFPI